MALVVGLGLRVSPAALRGLGFTVQQAPGGPPTATLPNLRLVGGEGWPGPGLLLHSPGPLPASLDGLPCSPLPGKGGGDGGWGEGPAHPNGVTRCDHLVVKTPDWARTGAALQQFGWRESLVREDVFPGVRLSFWRVGARGRGLSLELMAPAVPEAEESGPAALVGVAWVAGAGLEAVARSLAEGFTLSPGKAAIQPGRRIATLRGSKGLGLRMAFMTPRPDSK